MPLDHLLTYPGRLALTYNEPLVILIVSVWAITHIEDWVIIEMKKPVKTK